MRAIFYFLGFVALIGWAYVLFMSDVFVINAVEVEGTKTLDPVEINREVLKILDERPFWRPWPARHAWFIDEEQLARTLTERYFLTSTSVRKSSTHILRLKIQEQTHQFIFRSHQQYVLVDLKGVVLSEARPPGLPVIHRDLDERLLIGGRVADEQEIKSWLQNASEASLEGMRYLEFQPPRSPTSSRAIFKSTDGESIIVDTFEPLKPQIRAYMTFKQSQPKNQKIEEYIDVRIPGKVYVK